MESMTGYGRAEVSSGRLKIISEARSLNNRALDIRIKMPSVLNPFEPDIRKLFRENFSRGTIHLNLSVEGFTQASINLDRSSIKQLKEDLTKMKKELGIQGDVDLDILTRFPQVTRSSPPEIDEKMLWKKSERTIRKAISALKKSRLREGAATKRNINEHFKVLSVIARTIQRNSSSAGRRLKETIEKRVRELIDSIEINERRLEEEAAFLATRRDVSEEINRLAEHISAFKSTVNKPGPIGRNLEFISQEIHRELNTIASKTPGDEISHLAIQARVELEKIKEQIYNVE